MEGTCERCGLPVAADDAFCGSCGQPGPVRGAATGATTASGPLTGGRSGTWPGGRSGAYAPAGPGAGSGPGWAPAGGPGNGVSLDSAGAGWAPSTLYLGGRLAYSTNPENLDPLGNWRLLLQFFLRATLFSWLYWVGAAISGVIFLVLALAVSADIFFLYYVLGGLIFLALILAWLLLPVPIQLAEWKFMAEGRSMAAQAVLDHMGWSFAQRGVPLDVLQIRRLKLHSRQERDYLEVRQNQFSGFIGCFGYGRDLYLGWTYWWRVSPGRYLLMFLTRVWHSVTMRGTDLYVSLGYDYARALRETMHSVAMDGARVAIGETAPRSQEGGQRLQVAVAEVDS